VVLIDLDAPRVPRVRNPAAVKWKPFVTGVGLRAAKVDLATGRVTRDLGRAVLAGDLVLRTDRNETWVVRLGDGRVAGTLPFFAPADCGRHRPFLSCPTDRLAVTVWRIDEP
jgi:hypothetical protein